jgi:hypothetical protein
MELRQHSSINATPSRSTHPTIPSQHTPICGPYSSKQNPSSGICPSWYQTRYCLQRESPPDRPDENWFHKFSQIRRIVAWQLRHYRGTRLTTCWRPQILWRATLQRRPTRNQDSSRRRERDISHRIQIVNNQPVTRSPYRHLARRVGLCSRYPLILGRRHRWRLNMRRSERFLDDMMMMMMMLEAEERPTSSFWCLMVMGQLVE